MPIFRTKQLALVGTLVLAAVISGIAASQAVTSTASLSIEAYSFIMPNFTDVTQGSNARFAIDPKGGIHIAYQSGNSSQNLYYVNNVTGDWGVPEMIDDPQGGVLTPDIAADTDGNIHIASPYNWAGGAYLTNITGAWTDVSMNGRYTPQIAVSSDNIAHIIYYNIKLSTNNFLGLTYWNSSVNFPITGIRDNNTGIRFEQFPDIAVDSTGKIHVVFEGSWNNTALGNIAVKDIYYETLDPMVEDPAFSAPVRISSVMSTGDYANWPQIYCDGNDQIHIGWIETKTVVENSLNVHRAFIQYLNYTSGFSTGDIKTINTVRAQSTMPALAVDQEGYAHFAYLGQPNDVYYCTNKGGTWAEERITNEPSWLTIPQIEIHPLTNEPVLLLIQPNGQGITNMIQILEKVDGEFGQHIDFAAELTGNSDHLTIVEQATSSFIELTQGQPANFTVTMTNPLEVAQTLDINLEFVANDVLALTGGTAVQSVSSLGGEESISKMWTFQASSAQSTMASVLVKSGDVSIGQLTFVLNIAAVPISIPGFLPGYVILCGAVGTLILIQKSRRIR